MAPESIRDRTLRSGLYIGWQGRIARVWRTARCVLRAAVAVVCSFFLQPEECSAQTLTRPGLEWSGYLQTDNRIRLTGANEVSWHEYRLDLRAGLNASQRARFFGEVWLRSLGSSNPSSLADLTMKERVAPTDIELREAYVDLYGFLDEHPDRRKSAHSFIVRVGRQRIGWGTADRLNPTDNLNAYDLEDAWDFGRHLGSDAISVRWSWEDLSVQAVFIPVFTPAVLPKGEWLRVLVPPFKLPLPVSVGMRTETVDLPGKSIRESASGGVRISKKALGYEWSLSYMVAREQLPLVTHVVLTPALPGQPLGAVARLGYPRNRVLGLDAAGAVHGIEIWGEAALHLPARTAMSLEAPFLSVLLPETVVLDDRPYAKFAAGFASSIKSDFHVGAQLLHGFLHERGKENLHDYLFLRVEWDAVRNRLKLVPLNAVVEIASLRRFSENSATVLWPEVVATPFDRLQITIGARWIDGKGGTTFGELTEADELYLRMRYNF